MDRTFKGKKQALKMALTAAIAAVIIMTITAAPSLASDNDETAIEQRVIKIEGSVDKPRVIFIVPRAKLIKHEPGKNGFSKELSEPAHPGKNSAETPEEGKNKVKN